MNIYRYAPFKSNPFGHGGEKRAQQITEMLERLEIKYDTLIFEPIIGGSRLKRLICLPNNYKFIRSLKIGFTSFRKLWDISSSIYFLKQQIQQIMPASLIIYEHAASLNWFIPIFLKQQGHKLIAIPHNLETLVIEQNSKLSNLPNPEGFFDEILVLKSADLVLAISKEEEWLLNLFGINTIYFPYSPCNAESKSLVEINNIRSKRIHNKNYLIFGTAGNPPTRLGMIELLSNLNNVETINMTFHIAGFSTEKICEEMKLPNRFIFHGSVEVKKLYELYKSVDAVIIHQKPSTGSLTKIPELLKAGIPVIANQHAARNFFNVNGVCVYRSFDELLNILSKRNEINHPINFKVDMDLKNIEKPIFNLINS